MILKSLGMWYEPGNFLMSNPALIPAIHQAKPAFSQSNYFSAVQRYSFVQERMFDHPVH
jgi:hypothetical protein